MNRRELLSGAAGAAVMATPSAPRAAAGPSVAALVEELVAYRVPTRGPDFVSVPTDMLRAVCDATGARWV